LGVRVYLAVSRGQDRPDRHRRGGLALPLCRQRGRKRDLRARGVAGGIFGAEKGGERAMKKILVLFGGCSPEYAVSLQSAYSVLRHMDRERYRPIPVGITQAGDWFLYLL